MRAGVSPTLPVDSCRPVSACYALYGCSLGCSRRAYDLAGGNRRLSRFIEQQQGIDRNWRPYQATLAARMVAVVDARRAFAKRELGAGWAFRQSLVDLASVCELLAGELPRPRV